jgi:hypothetical protein
MPMTNSHTEFILSPVTDIISDVVNSSVGIGNGIETFPLCDYVMQSVFIKMTGFQEQKMKSVCWSLASNDFEYRYELTRVPLGECSSYDDKQEVYADLISQIKKRNVHFKLSNGLDKDKLLTETTAKIKSEFAGTNLSIWAQKSFNEYDAIWSHVKVSLFANNESILFSKSNQGFSLRTLYEDHLYRHRNRIAHNTQSYQQNLPTLKTLLNENYRYENYFSYFSVLVLIDNIFIELFKTYLTLLDEFAE